MLHPLLKCLVVLILLIERASLFPSVVPGVRPPRPIKGNIYDSQINFSGENYFHRHYLDVSIQCYGYRLFMQQVC